MDEVSGRSDLLADYFAEDDPRAKLLGSKRQQRKLRQLGLSPPFLILNRKVFYPVAGFQTWFGIQHAPARARAHTPSPRRVQQHLLSSSRIRPSGLRRRFAAVVGALLEVPVSGETSASLLEAARKGKRGDNAARKCSALRRAQFIVRRRPRRSGATALSPPGRRSRAGSSCAIAGSSRATPRNSPATSRCSAPSPAARQALQVIPQ